MKKLDRLPIVLASKSPRRKAILTQIGLDFSVQESNFEEIVIDHAISQDEVVKVVIENAKGKAIEVAKKHQDTIIIGSDTLVFYKNQVIGKPKDKDDALRILKLLNGSTHFVISGISVVVKHKDSIVSIEDVAQTQVTARKVEEEMLIRYVNTGEPLDKAGAYGIQEKGALFMEKVDGDFFNVVGFPLSKFVNICQKLGIPLV